MLLERICTYRKGKQTAERKVHRMNEKTRIQIEEMKKQTIGVEVEMYNLTREKAARTIAEYFHTEGTVKYIGGSYSAWACKDNKGREWKITRDSSIQAASDDEKAELGTPILTYEDIPDLQEILRQLRHKGAKSDPAHMCGVHYASLRIIKKILKKPPFYQPVLSKSFHNNHSQYLLSQSRSDGLFRYSIGAVSGDFICSLAALSAS